MRVRCTCMFHHRSTILPVSNKLLKSLGGKMILRILKTTCCQLSAKWWWLAITSGEAVAFNAITSGEAVAFNINPSELWRCVKVEVDVLGSPSLIVQSLWTWSNTEEAPESCQGVSTVRAHERTDLEFHEPLSFETSLLPVFENSVILLRKHLFF